MNLRTNLICLFLFSGIQTLFAQTWVTIPDAEFAAYLQQKHPECMNGNQMDITCNGIITEDSIDVTELGVTDIEGIQYFTSLTFLTVQFNWELDHFPALPSGIRTLNFSGCSFSAMPDLPPGLEVLYCGENAMLSIESVSLPATLKQFYVGGPGNDLFTTLPALPEGLEVLHCGQSDLVALPTLPSTLKQLDCWQNNLTELPELPVGLIYLSCWENQINCFPVFPEGLTYLEIWDNPYTCVPNIVDAMNSWTDLPVVCVTNGPNNPYNCAGIAGVNENVAFEFQVSPNPGSGLFRIQLSEQLGSSSLTVYNSIGEEVVCTTALSDEIELNLSALPEGIYQVCVVSASGKWMSKLVKQ